MIVFWADIFKPFLLVVALLAVYPRRQQPHRVRRTAPRHVAAVADRVDSWLNAKGAEVITLGVARAA